KRNRQTSQWRDLLSGMAHGSRLIDIAERHGRNGQLAENLRNIHREAPPVEGHEILGHHDRCAWRQWLVTTKAGETGGVRCRFTVRIDDEYPAFIRGPLESTGFFQILSNRLP